MPFRWRPVTAPMPQLPSVKAVTKEDAYYHVRFRDPDEFAEIRTPAWAREAAREISAGSLVRMGRREGGDDWAVQSVLIDKHVGESKARTQAERVLEKLEG